MDSYVCGIKFVVYEFKKFSPFVSYFLRNKGVPESVRKRVHYTKSKYDLLRILSEMLFRSQM